VRWTIYLAAPYKEAIEAEAEAERVSITTVINRAVASYLARTST
jgi:ribbon-helix-helix CopG family protein